MGGLGLNLTGADTVIFLEHDWNPMKDLQVMTIGPHLSTLAPLVVSSAPLMALNTLCTPMTLSTPMALSTLSTPDGPLG